MKDLIYKRICPQCNKEIYHKDKYSFNKSITHNKVCVHCSKQNIGLKNKGRKRTEEFKMNLSEKLKGHPSIKGNIERSNKIRNKTIGRDVSSFHKGSTSFVKKCVICQNEFKCQPYRSHSNHFCNKVCQKQYYHLTGKWRPRFNPKACVLIEEYGKQNGYNFQHALNGGEFRIESLNFWVDGYDIEKNVVIEYNEKYHNKPIQKEKDKKRRESIIQTLKCEFIILNYNNKIEKYSYEK